MNFLRIRNVTCVLLIMTLLSSFSSFACDICGCGVGNNYVGILPDFSKKITGVRYRANSLWSDVGDDGAHTYLTTREHYKTIDAWGGWNITRNIRLMATVPYSFIWRQREGVHNRQNGIGDISLLGYYQPFSRRATLTRNMLMQSLWLGGGMKLATGRYESANRNMNATNPNLYQLGTGSYDFLLAATYDIRLQDMGLNANMQYKINTVNPAQYQYGNKLSVSAQFYYKLNVKNVLSVAPNAGMQYEYAATDRDRGYETILTGGKLLLATAGTELIAKKRITWGVNYNLPVYQNLARNTVEANSRWMVHVGVLF